METSTVKNWPYPTLFAHRGGGTLAPENTLAAIKMGNAHSFVAVEFDVKLSRDNVVLLMHDASLERTTNGVGLVAEKDIQELETLDAGAWHSAQFQGERIPRLSVLSKYLHWMGIMANIEIKPCPGREIDTGRIVAELCDELWRDRLVKPLISSFSVEALRARAPPRPSYRSACSWKRLNRATWHCSRNCGRFHCTAITRTSLPSSLAFSIIMATVS